MVHTGIPWGLTGNAEFRPTYPRPIESESAIDQLLGDSGEMHEHLRSISRKQFY